MFMIIDNKHYLIITDNEAVSVQSALQQKGLDVKISKRDEFVLENCTDTHFWATCSSKKQPIW